MSIHTAIVVGHNARGQGAVRVTDGVTEWAWNTQLAKLIKAHDPEGVGIFFRDPAAGGYSREIDKVYAEVSASGAKLSMELHFNGNDNPAASGGETWSSGSKGSLRLAKLVRERVDAVMGNDNRGIKIAKRHDNGGRSLWQGRPPAILTEPYFGTNAAGCLLATERMDQLAEAYYRSALEFLGRPLTETTSPPADLTNQQVILKIYNLVKPLVKE